MADTEDVEAHPHAEVTEEAVQDHHDAEDVAAAEVVDVTGEAQEGAGLHQ